MFKVLTKDHGCGSATWATGKNIINSNNELASRSPSDQILVAQIESDEEWAAESMNLRLLTRKTSRDSKQAHWALGHQIKKPTNF